MAKKLATVDEKVCVACGACYGVCPKDAISVNGCFAKIAPEICVGCGICEKTCPTGCISLNERSIDHD